MKKIYSFILLFPLLLVSCGRGNINPSTSTSERYKLIVNCPGHEDGDKEKAMQYFDDTYNTFSQFDEALNKLQKKMQQLGYNDITAIVTFEK